MREARGRGRKKTDLRRRETIQIFQSLLFLFEERGKKFEEEEQQTREKEKERKSRREN
jgi:hypothetical protein